MVAAYPILKKQKKDDAPSGKPHRPGDVTQGPLDPAFGQHRAFPISIDVTKVDLARSPKDVVEYLSQVRLEAEKDAPIDDDGIYYVRENKKRVQGDGVDSTANTEPQDTVDDTMSEYVDRRKVYSDYRSQLTELDAIDLPETAKEWKYFVFNNEPSFDLVAQIIEEAQQMKLMVYFTKWLNKSVDPTFAKWIFAMLDALDENLSPADLSVLRSLAKKADKQVNAGTDEPNTVLMNKIIAIAGNFYRQRDLL